LQLREALLQLVQGHIHRARQMPESELVPRAHIEQRHAALAQAAQDLLAGNGLERVEPLEAVRGDCPRLGAVALGHFP